MIIAFSFCFSSPHFFWSFSVLLLQSLWWVKITALVYFVSSVLISPSFCLWLALCLFALSSIFFALTLSLCFFPASTKLNLYFDTSILLIIPAQSLLFFSICLIDFLYLLFHLCILLPEHTAIGWHVKCSCLYFAGIWFRIPILVKRSIFDHPLYFIMTGVSGNNETEWT